MGQKHSDPRGDLSFPKHLPMWQTKHRFLRNSLWASRSLLAVYRSNWWGEAASAKEPELGHFGPVTSTAAIICTNETGSTLRYVSLPDLKSSRCAQGWEERLDLKRSDMVHCR
jgi:hypothetical protein